MDKKKQSKRQEMMKALETIRGETSTSLITVKDFNDTCRLDKRLPMETAEEQDDRAESSSR